MNPIHQPEVGDSNEDAKPPLEAATAQTPLLTFDLGAVRRRCGKSLVWVSVQAGVSVGSARMYESNQKAVGERVRRLIAPVYQRLADEMTAEYTQCRR